MAIHFFSEGIEFKFPKPSFAKKWLRSVIIQEKKQLANLNFIFCNDAYLHTINLNYLSHNSFTDIITFDMGTDDNSINGEIYISVDRVNDNSKKYTVVFQEELHRVLVHGVLHLCGYKDKTAQQKLEMRERESTYLSLRW